jgi:hypothetical protein
VPAGRERKAIMTTTPKLDQPQLAASSLPTGPASPSAQFLHAPEFDHVPHFKVVS